MTAISSSDVESGQTEEGRETLFCALCDRLLEQTLIPTQDTGVRDGLSRTPMRVRWIGRPVCLGKTALLKRTKQDLECSIGPQVAVMTYGLHVL